MKACFRSKIDCADEPRRVGRLRQIVDVLGQTRLVTGRRVLVDNAFVYGLIDKRNRREQQLSAGRLILSGNSVAELFDRRAQFAAVAAVDLVAFCVLSDALLC